MDGWDQVYNNPMFHMGAGLLSRPNDIGRGLLGGVQSYQGYQQNALQQQLLASSLAEMERKRKEEEMRRQAQTEALGLLSQAPRELQGPPMGEQFPGYRMEEDPQARAQLETINRAYPGIAGKMLQDRMFPQQAKPVVVGNALVDPSTGKAIYQAPQKPDQQLVEIYDPNSPTGTRMVPRSEAAGKPGKPGSGLSVSFDPETGELILTQGRQMTKKTTGALEGDIKSTMETLNRLEGVATDYRKDYMTYMGQARAGASRVAEKAGFDIGKANKEFLKGKTRFRNGISQFFNQYRKEITGAAASVQELDRLMKSLMNEDMSQSEFEAAFSQFVNLSKRQLALKNQLMQQGLSGKALVNALNRDYSLATGSSQQMMGEPEPPPGYRWKE